MYLKFCFCPQIRGNIHKHGGYEVEGEDCRFVVSFSSAASAVEFAAAFLTASICMARDNDVMLVDHLKQGESSNGVVVLGGSRLKLGMCSGIPSRVQACIRTGRMEYFGTIMVRIVSRL
jgi:hypothetical protein